MRAVQVVGYHQNLELTDVPTPEITGPFDVIVRIGGAGVCRTDIHILEGQWAEKSGVSLPYTIGHENAGWVHAVGSARHALDLLRRSVYEAIVADIAMPEMDGLELTRTVRRLSAHAGTPILLVSARGDAQGSALSAGADGFITKADCASGRLLGELSRIVARRKDA